MPSRLLATTTLALSLLVGTAGAQTPCSRLAVSGTGQPGTDLVFNLTNGAASAPAFLVIGETTGSFEIRFGALGTLSLGLMPPFVPLPIGATDGQGAATLTLPVPQNFPGSVDLHGQAFTVEFRFGGGRPTIDFCESNVAPFHIGT